MALYRYVLHEPDADGFSSIGPELEEVRCFLCGAEAHSQVCPGDERAHHHGMVHTVEDGPDGSYRRSGLDAVCNNCILVVRKEWDKRKQPSTKSLNSLLP